MTENKIKWAMKAYVRWMNCRNDQVQHDMVPLDRIIPSPDELLQYTKQEICKVLCTFVVEAKNADGFDYDRDTLYDLIVMVQSFLKQNRRPMKFFEEDVFFYLKNT